MRDPNSDDAVVEAFEFLHPDIARPFSSQLKGFDQTEGSPQISVHLSVSVPRGTPG